MLILHRSPQNLLSRSAYLHLSGFALHDFCRNNNVPDHAQVRKNHTLAGHHVLLRQYHTV